MVTKTGRRVALATLATLGIAAAPASANISPINVGIQLNSTNVNYRIPGFINMTCSSGLRFWTPASGNGPVPLTGDSSSNPRFNACNTGTVSTGSGWTIAMAPINATQNTVTIQIPTGGSGSGGATISGTICGTITFTATSLTGTYTDGATTLQINPGVAANAPYTTTFCGSGLATLTATYTLSLPVTVT